MRHNRETEQTHTQAKTWKENEFDKSPEKGTIILLAIKNNDDNRAYKSTATTICNREHYCCNEEKTTTDTKKQSRKLNWNPEKCWPIPHLLFGHNFYLYKYYCRFFFFSLCEYIKSLLVVLLYYCRDSISFFHFWWINGIFQFIEFDGKAENGITIAHNTKTQS